MGTGMENAGAGAEYGEASTGAELENGAKSGDPERTRSAPLNCPSCAIERSRIPVVAFLPADEATFDWLPPEAPALDTVAIQRLMRRARRDPKTGCLIWTGGRYAKSAYGAIVYEKRTWRAHRLSWVAHKGEIPNGLYVCHACDNPSCIAIEHLFLGTPKDNMTDMRIKGRGRFRARLSMEDVMRVKRMLEEGMAMARVARETGVSYASVYAIKSGKNWRDV